MKTATTVHVLLAAVFIGIFSAGADEWDAPIGPEYGEEPTFDEIECLRLVRSYYNEGSYVWALETAEEYLKYYPRGKDRPEVEYITVRCHLNQGEYDGILEGLDRMMSEYSGTRWAVEAADLYVDLLGEAVTPWDSSEWAYWLSDRYDVYYYDYENPKVVKARKNALKKAEKVYKKYMSKKTGAEREELADRNVNNYMKMMRFVVFDTWRDPEKTFDDKVSYVKDVLRKEMSRDMRSVLGYYIASIIAEYYYVDPTGWNEDVHGNFYEWTEARRFAVVEGALKVIADDYGDAVGGIAAKAALADYAVVHDNEPLTAAKEFDELASTVKDKDYAEFFEGLAEGLRGPALAILSVESKPGGKPDVKLEIAAKLYDEVEVNVYPVDPKSYQDVPGKLDAVDLFLKDGRKVVTDIEAFYKQGLGETVRSKGIDRVEPRPSTDLPGVGPVIKSTTTRTGYAGDLRVSVFTVDIGNLEPGLYLAEVKTDDNMARALFVHSGAAAVYTTDDESLFFEFVDPDNGEPVPFAGLYAYNEFYDIDESGYNRRYREDVKLEPRPAGGGYVADITGLEGEGHIYVTAETADGPAFFDFEPPSGELETDNEMGIIYTDRPLYRPEQVVGFKAILRHVDFEGKVIEPIVKRKAGISLTSPIGDEIWTGEAVTDEYGALWGSIKLPPGAPLGTYDLRCEWVVLKEGEKEPYYPDQYPFRIFEEPPAEEEVPVEEKHYGASWRFDLEEYEKPEYEVNVTAEKDRYRSGETVRVVVEGRYFFGSPMANAYVEYEVYRSGNTDDKYGYEYYKLKKKGDGRTDKNGRYIIEFPTEYAGKYDNHYDIEVKVTDESNHVIDEYCTVYTFRSDLFVELEVDKYSYHPGETVELTLNTTDWYDDPVSVPVTVTAYTYKWVPYEGYVRGVVLYSTAVVTGYDGTARHAVELPRVVPTDEILIVCSAVDDYGTETSDSTTVSIVPEEVITAETIPEVEITVDDDYPTLGDTITVYVRSRFKGVTTGILFFSDRMAQFENVKLNRDPEGGFSARFDVVIDDRFLPKLRLRAVVVKDGVYYEDTAYVEIKNVNTYMNIAVELDNGEYRPGDTAGVTVKCTDYDGLPVKANLSLSGVDVSLLALRSDRTDRLPDYYREGLYREFYPYVSNSLDVAGGYSTATYLFRYYKGYYSGRVAWPGTVAEKFLNTITLPDYVKPEIQKFLYLSGTDLLNPENYDYMTVWETVKGPVGSALVAPVVEIGAGKGMETMEIAEETEFPEDPLKREGYPRAPAVPTSDAFGDVFVGRGTAPKKVTIDGREFVQTRLRTYFSDSAYWKPDLYTDESGEVKTNVLMPDNLTSWKFIALGVDKGQRIGWDYGKCNVTKNVLVRLVTPRHMVVGDTAVIKAIVHNYLNAEKEFAVAIDLDNVMLAGGLRSDFRSVEPDGTFAFKQTVWADRPGEATFTAIALSDVESDAMTKSIKVHPHGIVKRQSFCGRLRDSVEHALTVDEGMDPDTFEARLVMAPSIAYILSQGLDFFREYPYDCMEQVANRFLINAILAEGAGEMGLNESELSAGLTDAIDEGIANLAETQTGEGGWPWWKGGKASPYITAYVLDGLLTIRNSPFLSEPSAVKVDNMTAPAKRYLNRYLMELMQRFEDREDWELSLYVADVLLRHGLAEPDNEIILKTADYYFENREVKSDRGLALLGSVLYHTGQEDRLATVLRNLDNGAKVGPDRTIYWGDEPAYCWRWWQDSVETTAKVLDLKMLAQPASEQVPHMVDWLVDQRRGAAWKSTKDSAEATKTLIRYLLKYPEISERVAVGYALDGKREDKLSLDPTDYEEPEATVLFDVDDFNVGTNLLKLTRYKGTSPVFYTAAVKYYTEAEDIPASVGSVTIERDYYVIKRKLKKGRFEEERVPLNRPLEAGEEVEVEITINSPYDFDYVVVEDPRPAGCIYTETASGYDWWLDAYVELKTEKRAVLMDRLGKGETKFSYRLRAEIPGDFGALPATVYGMYSPDIGSSTASTRIVVNE